jgi:hypothetical protein
VARLPAPWTGVQRLIAPIALAGVLASGCGTASATVPILLSGSALPSDTASPSPSVEASPSSPAATPSPTVAPSHNPADLTAPPNLPHGYHGVIIGAGECFDLDEMDKLSDSGCDLYLDDTLVINPRNGTVMAQQGQLLPPSLFECRAAAMVSSPIAPRLDSYMCLKTSQARYGFLVQREDKPTAPPGRIVIDYWLY